MSSRKRHTNKQRQKGSGILNDGIKGSMKIGDININ